MFELTVTTARRDDVPAVFLDKLYRFSHFHGQITDVWSSENPSYDARISASEVRVPVTRIRLFTLQPASAAAVPQ